MCVRVCGVCVLCVYFLCVLLYVFACFCVFSRVCVLYVCVCARVHAPHIQSIVDAGLHLSMRASASAGIQYENIKP